MPTPTLWHQHDQSSLFSIHITMLEWRLRETHLLSDSVLTSRGFQGTFCRRLAASGEPVAFPLSCCTDTLSSRFSFLPRRSLHGDECSLLRETNNKHTDASLTPRTLLQPTFPSWKKKKRQSNGCHQTLSERTLKTHLAYIIDSQEIRSIGNGDKAVFNCGELPSAIPWARCRR